MMSVGLHCRIVGRPGRARALDRFLQHVRAQDDDVWVTTRADDRTPLVREHHPPAGVPLGRLRPGTSARSEEPRHDANGVGRALDAGRRARCPGTRRS